MRQPSNGLGASNPLATFGGSVLFNSFQFAYQLTLAQNQGAVNIQSRPFGIVSDGDTFDLVAGTQIPVVTTTIAGGAPFQSGQVQFIEASRIARITPQVAEDEQKSKLLEKIAKHAEHSGRALAPSRSQRMRAAVGIPLICTLGASQPGPVIEAAYRLPVLFDTE